MHRNNPWVSFRSALPLIALFGVALHQAWLASSRDLTPWKGGGFGMFSTVDAGESRAFRTELILAEARFGARDAPHSSMRRRARNLPTTERLSAYADRLLTERWRIDPKSIAHLPHRRSEGPIRVPMLRRLPRDQAAACGSFSLQAVAVEVLRPSFDARTGTYRLQVLNRVLRKAAS